MKRHIPGLHLQQQDRESALEGLFLARVDAASYRWHPQKPFLSIRFVLLEPEPFAARPLSGRLYCTDRALWKLNWFLRDFGYDPICSAETRWMRKRSPASSESFGHLT
jgi:hypothetical protein